MAQGMRRGMELERIDSVTHNRPFNPTQMGVDLDADPLLPASSPARASAPIEFASPLSPAMRERWSSLLAVIVSDMIRREVAQERSEGNSGVVIGFMGVLGEALPSSDQRSS
jgi:hypothetical protein